MFERILYGLIGMLVSFLIVKYRFTIEIFTGELVLCRKWLGSTKNGIVLFGIFVFFLSLLYMTDNLDLLVPEGVKLLF